jgi:prepilin-type N-terminal cleavage/methylation domain-containing protein
MPRNARSGVTLLELLVVLALLLILAAAIAPSISGMRGNDYQRNAAAALRTRLSDARAFAMEDGKAYRVAISPDGTRIRMAADVTNFAELQATNPPEFLSRVNENTLEKATVEVVAEEDQAPETDQSGWVTVATFKPDGTCKRDRALVYVKQDGYPPTQIQIRGVTGTVRTLTTQPIHREATPNPGGSP